MRPVGRMVGEEHIRENKKDSDGAVSEALSFRLLRSEFEAQNLMLPNKQMKPTAVHAG